MADMSFSDILQTRADEIGEDPQWLDGRYRFKINGQFGMGKSSQKGTPFVQFPIVCEEVLELQDPSEAEAFGGKEALEGRQFSSNDPNKMGFRFYLSDNTVTHRMLRNFLRDSLGIDSNGRTLQEMLEDTPSQEFIGQIEHESPEGSDRSYPRIRYTSAVE